MSRFKKFYEEYYEDYKDENEREFKAMFKNGILKDKVLKNMLNAFKKNNVKSVCDIGCGYGYITSFLNKQGIKADGVDLSVTRIKRANELNPGPNYQVGDAENEKLPGKYDAVYSLNTIEHIYDFDALLQNIHAALNDNGLVFLGTPNVLAPRTRLRVLLGTEKHLALKTHIHFFTIQNLRDILTKNGFEVYAEFGTGKLSFLSTNLAGNIYIIGRKK
jgi:2-polyprenyl-3-methyl-5-hydroxy-6-metoxy-1,4-benzoquinol methylase